MDSESQFLFGKILTVQGFATEDQVRRCLKIQEDTHTEMPLGEILINEGYLSESQLVAALEIQHSAFEEIDEESGKRKRDILFGQMIIDRDLASPREVYDAIRVQERSVSEGTPKLLGEILVEKGILTPDQVMEVLDSQKKTIVRCPHCGIQYNLQKQKENESPCCPECGWALEETEDEIPLAVSPRGPKFESDAYTLELETFGPGAGLGEDPLIGAIIGGCEIRELIGAGGIGKVYKGFQTRLQRVVAVKILSEELASKEDHVERLFREARAVAACNHPSIIQVHDVGREGPNFFLILEYVQGKTLSECVAEDEAWEPWKALEIVAQVAKALAEAESKNIIHRDIKPDNILITGPDIVKVADFGLAKNVADKRGITFAGFVLGTPCYMSPEHCRGEKLDIRSDIYALGATFYYMLAGRPPFRGETPQIIINHHLKTPPRPLNTINPEIPPPIERIVTKMLRKSKEDRYQSARELVEDINGLMERRIRKDQFWQQMSEQKEVRHVQDFADVSKHHRMKLLLISAITAAAMIVIIIILVLIYLLGK